LELVQREERTYAPIAIGLTMLIVGTADRLRAGLMDGHGRTDALGSGITQFAVLYHRYSGRHP